MDGTDDALIDRLMEAFAEPDHPPVRGMDDPERLVDGFPARSADDLVQVVQDRVALARDLAAARGDALPTGVLLAIVAGGPRGDDPRVRVGALAARLIRQQRAALVVRGLPEVAGVARVVWGRGSARALARRAAAILDGQPAPPDPVPADPEIVAAQQMVALANLVRAGGSDPGCLRAILARSELPAESCEVLAAAFDQPRQHPVDFGVFGPDEQLPLMVDLVALAHRGGATVEAERRYVDRVAQRIRFPLGDLPPDGCPMGSTAPVQRAWTDCLAR